MSRPSSRLRHSQHAAAARDPNDDDDDEEEEDRDNEPAVIREPDDKE